MPQIIANNVIVKQNIKKTQHIMIRGINRAINPIRIRVKLTGEIKKMCIQNVDPAIFKDLI